MASRKKQPAAESSPSSEPLAAEPKTPKTKPEAEELKADGPKLPKVQLPKLSKYQTFHIERVIRSSFRGSQWNPRKITQWARKRLRESLKTSGLVQPIIVSSVTMTVVGGHQKLSILDALEGRDDYMLDVAMVDGLTPVKERELALFLNNLDAQGEWDLPKLANILRDVEHKVDIDAAGFEPLTLEAMFDGSGIAVPMFAQTPEAIEEAVGLIGERASPTMRRLEQPSEEDLRDAGADEEPQEGGEEGEGAPEGGDDDPEVVAWREKEAARARRQARKDQALERSDTEYYAIVVFKDRAERERFMGLVGSDPQNKYVSGSQVFAKMGAL